jgi:hypothetical protein
MEAGRGIRHAAGGLLRRYPLDAAAAALAAALALGIVVNALALQTVIHHPARRAPAPPARVARPMPVPKPPAVAPLPPREATAAPAALPAEAAPAAPTESLVSAIQAALKRRGVYRDKVDGELGPKTEAAILSFQVAAGLPTTGQPSEALLRVLRQ